MKSSVAIALILAGVILIAVPAISDYLHQRNTANVLVDIDFERSARVNLAGPMSSEYRFGCWLAGIVSIGCAIILPITTRDRNKSIVLSSDMDED